MTSNVIIYKKNNWKGCIGEKGLQAVAVNGMKWKWTDHTDVPVALPVFEFETD